MTIGITDAQHILAAQPFSQLLGARLTRWEPGIAEVVIPLNANLRQQHGSAHGGALSYAADTAITFAAGTVAGDSVLTAEMKINYLRGARGNQLIARAAVAHSGSTLVIVRCEVFDLDTAGEQLCAIAQGTVARR
jgi:uncharacterized protein (TIGR00369 family)